MVDSFSKWPEVVIVNSTTSEATVNALRTMFSRVGVPQTLVSDNAPQFKSQEFKERRDKQMERSSQNLRQFREGDMVWVRDYHGKEKWVRGTISAKCGPLTYQVIVDKGLWKRHIDQLS